MRRTRQRKNIEVTDTAEDTAGLADDAASPSPARSKYTSVFGYMKTDDESVDEAAVPAVPRPLDPSLADALNQPLLTELPTRKRWADAFTRFIWTWIMISGFVVIILSGPFAVSLMVLSIQIQVFQEVIAIAHVPNKEKKLPWFRALNWFFLLVTNYYLYGETMIAHFKTSVLIDAFLQPLATHHRFLSFALYCLCFIYFVMNLKKGHYKFQFVQFFWTHMTLLMVVTQSHFIISSIFEGLIWFILPVSLVICNDIFAYVGGFFFGRTRLIALSPKKTWEGFLFGFLCTLMFSVLVSRFLIRYPYLTCPVNNLYMNAWSEIDCAPIPAFVPTLHTVSPPMRSLIRHVTGSDVRHVLIAPLQWHALAMAVFASIIAPFGGFFASGFKRAFKLKDFGVSIPGHGGITDRMDCQFIMGVFSYMYYTSFIKTYESITVGGVLHNIIDGLGAEEQLELYKNLHEYLIGQGIINE